MPDTPNTANTSTDATPLASEQITQEDREAAEKLEEALGFLSREESRISEEHFARHRIAALSASPAPGGQSVSGEVVKTWEPIASAPRDRRIIRVLVPLKDGGFIEGAAYFDPDAYDGTWWWDGTSNADYFTDPISECNHGDPLYWLPDSDTGEQASSLGIMTDQPVSNAATRPAALSPQGLDAKDGGE